MENLWEIVQLSRPIDMTGQQRDAPLSASDIEGLSVRSGYRFSWDHAPEENAPFMGGRFALNQIAEGMNVHVTSATEMTDAVAEFTVRPSVSIFLLMEGYLSFEAGGELWELGAGEDVNVHAGLIWSRAQECRIRRHMRRGRHVSKVAITLEPIWFEKLALPSSNPLMRFRRTHLAQIQWCPTARALRNASDILRPVEATPLQARLGIHRRALQIVQEALGVIEGLDAPPDPETPEVNEKAAAIRAHLDATLDRELSLDQIARDLGMSVSVLQARFRGTFEMTIGEYRRRQRLIRAHMALRDQGVTVGEAATIAGYSNPANFATAFGRQFGYAPSRARR